MDVHLFTYGTLRRGAPMHGLLDGHCHWIGAASAPGRLLDLGDFPALVAPRRKGERVQGEIYAVIDAAEVLLDTLDRYEGSRFARELETVQGPQGEVQAWLYRWLGDPRGRTVVTSGDYLAAAGSTARPRT